MANYLGSKKNVFTRRMDLPIQDMINSSVSNLYLKKSMIHPAMSTTPNTKIRRYFRITY